MSTHDSIEFSWLLINKFYLLQGKVPNHDKLLVSESTYCKNNWNSENMCFSYSTDDLCDRPLTDHNYYAICAVSFISSIGSKHTQLYVSSPAISCLFVNFRDCLLRHPYRMSFLLVCSIQRRRNWRIIAIFLKSWKYAKIRPMRRQVFPVWIWLLELRLHKHSSNCFVTIWTIISIDAESCSLSSYILSTTF